MHDLAPGVHTFPLEGPRLTAAQVEAIAHAVRALGPDAWLVIDCSALREVAPAGLAALLELGHALAPTRPLALAGLDRTLTRVAIETALARHFAVYADVQAFARARTRAQQLPAIAEPERCAL